ncbi:hypothetical protein [Prolixibacter sp. SD074]|jgi:hypothetical protein|uniref:hypothetical protein n=1 Tax=Prolixibacter sp. SD074 TaxID=2652391 RepID=UPI0012992A02|nr:hypothetical protein [Prolixibacter sp. SD074]
MFAFNSIKDLISTLYKEREIIDFLFSKRKNSVKYDNLLEFVNFEEEKLTSLIEKNILVQFGSTVDLNQDILDFLEKFTDSIEEINYEYTSGLIRILKENIQNWELEKRPNKQNEYLLKTKRNIGNVGKDVLRNITTLRGSVEDVFATEKVFSIKKSKLQEYDNKRKNLDELLEQIDAFFRESTWEYFIKMVQDDELNQIILRLDRDIIIARQNLIDITQKILDFINRIRQDSQIFKHIQKVKLLKDQLLLAEKSNFIDVISKDNSLQFQNEIRFSTPLSLDYIQSEEAYNILLRISYKLKKSINIDEKSSGIIRNEFLNGKDKNHYVVDTNKLKESFLSRGGDLFDFINNYNFEKELSFEEKVTLFCKLASQFRDDFSISDTYSKIENIEYALITPKL